MSGPSSSIAGPSTTPEVPLTIEPVHIYHTPQPTQTHHPSSLDMFDREPALHDITPSGTNIFQPRKPAAAQLSEDVLRLWSERGDFSRFQTSSLLAKRPHSPSSSSSGDDDSPRPALEQQDELTRGGNEKIGGTIAESEFVKLRNTVLGNLDVAHFNSIHAHQLLGMLIKQHRSTIPSNTLAGGGGGKMGSPAPSVSGQSARSGSTTAAVTPAVTKAPLGIFGHLNAQKAEEEFILDPLAISLSRTSLNPNTTRKKEKEEEDEEEDFDVDPTSAEYALKQASKEQESAPGYRENQLKEFKIVLETKRKAMESAAELLSAAAGELRSGQGANRERWRGLIGLYGRGWGVTPGRPLLDVERFGVAGGDDEEDGEVVEGGESGEGKEVKSKKKDVKRKEGKREKATAAGLQGFGTPIITSDGKVKEEGARDAWIGFGLPEAPIELRRRSLAYWADLPSNPSDPAGLTAEEVKRKLVFPDRMHRRLRVRFVLWPPSSDGKHQQDDRIEWSSDPIPSKQEAAPVALGHVLDQELQQASREATDELVFGDVVAQARLLPPTFGVRLTSSSVRIVLTKRLDCVVELVPTGKDDGPTEDSSQKEAGEPSREARYAPHAALLLAFLRMGPLRKYHAFVSATHEARKADAAARAAAIKAAALSVPKKSNAAGSAEASAASKTEAATGGKGGVGAGGRSTSAALCKLDSVGPVLVGLHYWSFVHRLGSVLRDVQEKALQRGLKVSIQLIPLTVPSTAGGSASLAHLTSTLAQMFDATASHPYPTTPNTERNAANIHSIYTSPDQTALSALKGHAKIFVATQSGGARVAGNRLVCTCSFAQPSLLSVQFSGGRMGKGVALTNKPLAVNLDTLRELVEKQLGQL
ncbi:hypothetical protein PHSY_003641 [Pseudozyma hubeiensis SY62]|uniref:Mediator complex subunit 17 n=1 Tax=Pseudozyma hubeiensis (strain SY62) TaxID=1305764 RepID=R9P480_PSEHS|nr:hypothetical protein PHSY_003641 [Pseudozyma hubeiensis SY62]GAC96062.1 hypothetical protein PHSY_003641 [Pseudozyma hubeiensis SY62]